MAVASAERSRRWRLKNLEKERAYRREYHQKNREKVLASNRKYYEQHREEIRARRRLDSKKDGLKYKYGMTIEQWDEMFLRQGGRCAICEEATELQVDHCHDSGRVRELLCRRCNTSIGQFQEDPELLARAAAYVTKWRN